MKLVNETAYHTPDIRAIIRWVMAQELEPRRGKGLLVVVKYGRRGPHGISGWARIGRRDGSWTGRRMRLFLPRDPSHVSTLPWRFELFHVIRHECGHLKGLDHPDMRGLSRYTWKAGWEKWEHVAGNAWPDGSWLYPLRLASEVVDVAEAAAYNPDHSED